MVTHLPDGAQKVQDFLVNNGCRAKVRVLPSSTATAHDAALALGVPLSYIGKSVVFGSNQGLIVAVICGDQRVDTEALARNLEVSSIEPLKAEDVRSKTGYVIGGVSPFGLPEDVRVVVDSKLGGFEECYVAAGHPKAIVHVQLKELLAITNAHIGSITAAA
jgi:Cys-tRNA(Pro) deacylase